MNIFIQQECINQKSILFVWFWHVSLQVQGTLKRQWMQYKAQWGQRRREHCSMGSTSYTATSITEVPAFMFHHDCNSEHLNGKQTEDSELVALKTGETYAWTFGEKDKKKWLSQTGDWRLLYSKATLTECSQTLPSQTALKSRQQSIRSLCVGTIETLLLCFCELKRKGSEEIQTRAAFLKICHIKAARFRLPSHPGPWPQTKKVPCKKKQRMCRFVGQSKATGKRSSRGQVTLWTKESSSVPESYHWNVKRGYKDLSDGHFAFENGFLSVLRESWLLYCFRSWAFLPRLCCERGCGGKRRTTWIILGLLESRFISLCIDMHRHVFCKQKQNKKETKIYIYLISSRASECRLYLSVWFWGIFSVFWSATSPVSAFPLCNQNPLLMNAPNSLHVFN